MESQKKELFINVCKGNYKTPPLSWCDAVVNCWTWKPVEPVVLEHI